MHIYIYRCGKSTSNSKSKLSTGKLNQVPVTRLPPLVTTLQQHQLQQQQLQQQQRQMEQQPQQMDASTMEPAQRMASQSPHSSQSTHPAHQQNEECSLEAPQRDRSASDSLIQRGSRGMYVCTHICISYNTTVRSYITYCLPLLCGSRSSRSILKLVWPITGDGGGGGRGITAITSVFPNAIQLYCV